MLMFDHVMLMFDRVLATGLKLKVGKCKPLRTEVGFLGHRISAWGLATDPVKAEAVWKWPTRTI